MSKNSSRIGSRDFSMPFGAERRVMRKEEPSNVDNQIDTPVKGQEPRIPPDLNSRRITATTVRRRPLTADEVAAALHNRQTIKASETKPPVEIDERPFQRQVLDYIDIHETKADEMRFALNDLLNSIKFPRGVQTDAGSEYPEAHGIHILRRSALKYVDLLLGKYDHLKKMRDNSGIFERVRQAVETYVDDSDKPGIVELVSLADSRFNLLQHEIDALKKAIHAYQEDLRATRERTEKQEDEIREMFLPHRAQQLIIRMNKCTYKIGQLRSRSKRSSDGAIVTLSNISDEADGLYKKADEFEGILTNELYRIKKMIGDIRKSSLAYIPNNMAHALASVSTLPIYHQPPGTTGKHYENLEQSARDHVQILRPHMEELKRALSESKGLHLNFRHRDDRQSYERGERDINDEWWNKFLNQTDEELLHYLIKYYTVTVKSNYYVFANPTYKEILAQNIDFLVENNVLLRQILDEVPVFEQLSRKTDLFILDMEEKINAFEKKLPAAESQENLSRIGYYGNTSEFLEPDIQAKSRRDRRPSLADSIRGSRLYRKWFGARDIKEGLQVVEADKLEKDLLKSEMNHAISMARHDAKFDGVHFTKNEQQSIEAEYTKNPPKIDQSSVGKEGMRDFVVRKKTYTPTGVVGRKHGKSRRRGVEES